MKKLFVILSIFMLVGSMLVPAAMAFDTSSGTELAACLRRHQPGDRWLLGYDLCNSSCSSGVVPGMAVQECFDFPRWYSGSGAGTPHCYNY
ncbi:MAG: hypothetical protein KCCBMMGE_02223 [Candidatus Methanoperedenaceae archaeon GB37]|nr:MAG: hypothetical protein KCCBMMGE_02223 [Candidatus Methanoperedenaceae archaeon GB37]